MSGRKLASDLFPRDVLRLPGSRRGRGRKVVVTSLDRESESIGVNYLPVINGGELLGSDGGWTSLRSNEKVAIIGNWHQGLLTPGADGELRLFNEPGEDQEKGRATMATAKTAAKRGTKSATPAAKKAAAKPASEGSTRASDAELDKLAARVVTLRDDQNKSWGEIEEALEVNPGRLRSLYNRGGGKPSGARSGSAKTATKAKSGSGKSSAAKGGAAKTRRRRSAED